MYTIVAMLLSFIKFNYLSGHPPDYDVVPSVVGEVDPVRPRLDVQEAVRGRREVGAGLVLAAELDPDPEVAVAEGQVEEVAAVALN